MPRLYLGLVLHNHQPVGNYGFVIEQVYQQAYAPMLAALERHPGVRVAMHNSGCLLDWLEAEHPDHIDRLRALCDRGQIEMMTGGYYEPILPAIPDGDKLGQISKLTAYIGRRFGQHPDGLWLTERVWEPGLPAPLAAAGVRWSLVDDAHFRMVGLRQDQLDGYYITEDQGQRIRLFAGSQRLRYTIPWLNVDDVIAELRQVSASATGEAPYVVLGDDGEKFGAWPTTYAHVWEEGWLERFFAALEAEGDWLELITPGEYAARFDARGLAYLPTASYAEMMEWALPAESSAEYHRVARQAEAEGRSEVARYLRGGVWRYFLAKYPEANALHKRGLRVDAKLAALPAATAADEARDALWQAQCNCPYWHGVFGGLYLRHIRAATATNLVRAERLADEAAGAHGVRISEDDVDFDGHDDILLQSPAISLLVHPKLGGMISEFDLRPRDHALLNVLARRREAYHEELTDAQLQPESAATNIHGAVRVKEEGLVDALIFDRFRRGGLQEWVLAPGSSVHEFARGEAHAAFDPSGAWESACFQTDDTAHIRLWREHDRLRIVKEIAVALDEAVSVAYRITNTGVEHRTGIFVSEWNLSPPHAPGGDDRTAVLDHAGGSVDLAAAPGAVEALRSFSIRGSAPYALRCESPEPLGAWHFPVESISSSEGGVERVAQGVSVSLVRGIDLAPKAEASFGFRWSVVEFPAS
jgi:alpha-amylase